MPRMGTFYCVSLNYLTLPCSLIALALIALALIALTLVALTLIALTLSLPKANYS